MSHRVTHSLRALRLGRGWSQATLAQEAHLATQTIVNLERGATNPRPRTVRKLAQALHLAPAQVQEALTDVP